MEFSNLVKLALFLYVVNEIDKRLRITTNVSYGAVPTNQIDTKVVLKNFVDSVLKKQSPITEDKTKMLSLRLERKVPELLPDINTIEASRWLPLINHPCVIVILGKKGSGKSALAYRLLELMRWIAPICVVGLPSSAHKYLPDWIEVYSELEDVPPNAIVMVDESYIRYHARSSMTSHAKELSQILNLSRQRGQTIIFVSQESRQADRDILSAAGIIIFKEPGLFQAKLDRHELLNFVTQAMQAFQSITCDRKKWSFVLTQEQGCVGLIENSLPSFWSEKLSRAFASERTCKARPAKKLTQAERQTQAKEYERNGFIPAQIARMMGLSKATIKNYLDDYPYRK